jgi:exopolyphosphatase/guanosine-5'-triphosphate,3'-diphosphate pyrophosphatase
MDKVGNAATMARMASLDLGTNTFRLLIGEPGNTGMRRLLVENRITRLGENLKEGGPLHPPALERSLSALAGFRGLMDEYRVALHRAVGTSALRRAGDAEGFIRLVRERTGIRVEVIPGLEEARLTSKGVLWAVGDRGRRVVVFDIGGGSTEFVFLEEGRPRVSRSLELGVVRLTERWLAHDPPRGAELEGLRRAVAGSFAEVEGLARQAWGEERADALVGTAGTPTTLAAMLLGLESYDPERVNGYVLRRRDLEGLLTRLCAQSRAERLRLPGLERGREDVILAGICIVLGAMLSFGTSEVVVSDGGLLDGVLLDLMEDPSRGASLSPRAQQP